MRSFKFSPGQIALLPATLEFDGVKKGGLAMARVVAQEEGLFKWHTVRVSKQLLADICTEVKIRIGNSRIKRITSPFIKEIIKDTGVEEFTFIRSNGGVVLKPLVVAIDDRGDIEVAIQFPFYAKACDQEKVINRVIKKRRMRDVSFSELGCAG